MALYQYAKLDSSNNEIRLMELFPGAFNETLRARIFHIPLCSPEWRITPQLSLDKLSETLPKGWRVRQTLEGRYLFLKDVAVDEPDVSSWTHPVSGVEPELYEGYAGEIVPYMLPAYEALSYVWGSDDRQEKFIVVDTDATSGKDHNSIMMIGQNLSSALRHLRSNSASRKLWVDAICIDQSDITERNNQVLRMADIYRLAERVIIWLGAAADDSAHALSTVDFLGNQLEFSIDHFLIKHPDAVHSDWYMPDTPLIYDERTLKALEKFFLRAWFERLWVVQEAGLSNHRAIVQCGNDVISWGSFRRAITLLDEKQLPSDILRQRLGGLSLFTGETTWSTKRLLAIARQKECSDVRDKLYGILSISPPDFSARIKPDYASPAAVIFKEASLAAINSSKRLTWLRFTAAGSSMLDMPSWASDWSSPPARLMCFGITMLVTGIVMTRIAAVGDEFSGELSQFRREFERLLNSFEDQDQYVSGGIQLDAFISTIVLSRQREVYPRHSYPTLAGWKEILLTDASSNLREIWMSRLCRWLKGRCFLQTTDRHFGLGLSSVLPDDVVTVLLGCQSPIILRQTEEDKDRYKVIGECFLNGAMFGETLLGPLPPNVSLQITINTTGTYDYKFVGIDSTGGQAVLREDPRLERFEAKRTARNAATSEGADGQNCGETETQECDERLLRNASKAIGLQLMSFHLL